jgi:hypothetical protein
MAVFIAMSGNTHRLTQKQKMPVELTTGVHFGVFMPLAIDRC